MRIQELEDQFAEADDRKCQDAVRQHEEKISGTATEMNDLMKSSLAAPNVNLKKF